MTTLTIPRGGSPTRRAAGVAAVAVAPLAVLGPAEVIAGAGGLDAPWASASTLAISGEGAGICATGAAVIGRYPDYVNLANSIGAQFFQLPSSVWSQMSAAEQWTANQGFLNSVIDGGRTVIFASDITQAAPGTGFSQEIQYLMGSGYQFDMTSMSP